MRRIGARECEGFALKTFQGELLRQQDIALDKAALGSEAPLSYALAVCAELLDVDRTGIRDAITGA